MGISIFQTDNTWLASLILDYQTGIVGYAEKWFTYKILSNTNQE